MKQFEFPIILLAALLVAGCRESIVEPIIAEDSPLAPNSVSFGGMVDIPDLGEEGRNVYVTGTSNYTFYAVDEDRFTKQASDLYDLEIVTEGRLTSETKMKPVNNPWTISGKSFDRISIAADNSVSLQKEYRVQGISEDVSINVLYEVRREKLVFLKMWVSEAF